jgi:MazG family protein
VNSLRSTTLKLSSCLDSDNGISLRYSNALLIWKEQFSIALHALTSAHAHGIMPRAFQACLLWIACTCRKVFLHLRSRLATVSRSRSERQKRSKLSRKSASKSVRRQIAKAPGSMAKASSKRIGKLFEDLVAVQSRLRAPGGCPWDREQTHSTLRTYLIEEAYEVLDAIEKENSQDLAEELGDLLLQVLFHADLARESGAFDISHVITGIHHKMVRRHPHVFGDVKAETAGEVLKNWAQLKAKEKLAASPKHGSQPKSAPSALDGVPRNIPALLEAYQLTRRAAQIGFDWERIEGIFEKLEEETAELRAALTASNRRDAEEEVGDILFSVVNLARFLGLDPEVTLKYSTLKFKERFQEMERKASGSGQHLSQLSKQELEDLWVAAKTKVRMQIPAKSDP